MATPGKYNFTFQRGSTWARILSAKGADGLPYDLTGYSIRMQIRTADGATGTTTTATLVLDLPNGQGISISDAVNGEITIELTAAQTQTLCPDNVRTRLSYGIELYIGAPEDVTPLLQGTISVLPEVVRG